jgi:hypothetical protein
MKKEITGFLVLTVFAFACNSKNEQQTDNTTPAGSPQTFQQTLPSGTVKHPPTKLGTLMNENTATNSFGAATSGVNPPHGMPGHTCDLPVGAPLNGFAAESQPLQVTSSADITAAAPVLTQPNPNVRLNPAHGEPGHDCAIPVGSPLPG